MAFFNLVHFLSRGRGLSLTALSALLMLQLPPSSFAESPDWGQWQEPSKNSDNGIPPGVAYPGGQGLCEGMQPAGKHAYWRCMPGCPGLDVVNQYCWQGVSDAIYTCPAPLKGFRRMEKIRYTKVHCGPKAWGATKHLADLYKETWQNGISDPPEVTEQLPPTTDEELPKTADGSSVPWDPSGPPWVKEDEKADTPPDTGKTDTPKTDTGKLDTPKIDTPKTDTAKTDTGQKTVTGGGSSTTPSNAKKANKKEVRNKGGGRTIDRSRYGDDIDQGGGLPPEAAAAIGIGIGMGLGGMGRGHMGGDRMGGDRMGGSRMMDR